MSLKSVYIPYGGYWSTPFCRWQGGLASEHSIKLAANSVKTFMGARSFDPASLDSLVLGFTVLQKTDFYGGPWLAGMIGSEGISGPNVSQACATSIRSLSAAALEVESGLTGTSLVVTCDRTSNGAHVYFPDGNGVGGMGQHENPVWDNFNKDPWGKTAMVQTAENVAAEAGISREEQNSVTLRRHEQYGQALADDRAFQKKYMIPVELKRGKKVVTIDADEGVFPTTTEGLAKLKPVLDGGSVTFGTQTHPADGNAGLIVTSKDKAAEMGGSDVTIQVLGFGTARVKKSFMPMAVVPAAKQALEYAGVAIDQCTIKTHNPFAVNDIYFARETGVDVNAMNDFGSPLIFGHPQGPTGARCLIELIEELAANGGGYGLFSGCAAGDTAMATVIKVS